MKSFRCQICLSSRLKQKGCVVNEHSTAAKDRPIWNKIWSLKVPPKVKNFLWRACSTILPTRDNLHRRKLHVELGCGFCCQKQQSMCCGAALLLETYGHYVGVSSKNAPMQPLISFLYFGYWWTNWSARNWRKTKKKKTVHQSMLQVLD